MRRGRLSVFLIVAVIAVLVPMRAAASTVNFAALLGGGSPLISCCGALRSYGTSLDFGGLTFTTTNSSSYGLSVWETSEANHPVGGAPTTSLFEYAALFEITITKQGGGTFDLFGIDLANWGKVQIGFPPTFNVTFVGTRPDTTTVTQTLTVNNAPTDASPVLQSFSLVNFTGLPNVNVTQEIYGAGTAFQFNNLVLDQLPNPSATLPEPGSICLLGR